MTSIEWIPVTERLPDTSRKVLISLRDTDPANPYPDGVCFGYYSGRVNEWCDDEDYTDFGWKVTAWAELPDAYKPED